MANKTAVQDEVVETVEEVQETGIYEGLAAIRKYKEDQAARKAAAEANKMNWLKMEDNETVRVWILQELDRGAENYKSECGIGLMATEHANPENWRLKALCTASEFSQCLGCEKHKEDWRAGWKQKSRIYLNVLVERKDGTREVAVMSQANGPQSTVGPLILELAVDENTITNRWYKLTKVVNNGKISYAFVPNMKESTEIDPSEYAEQLYDLHKAVRKVAYEDQFDYYFKVDEPVQQAAEPSSAPAWGSDSKGTDEEW